MDQATITRVVSDAGCNVVTLKRLIEQTSAERVAKALAKWMDTGKRESKVLKPKPKRPK